MGVSALIWGREVDIRMYYGRDPGWKETGYSLEPQSGELENERKSRRDREERRKKIRREERREEKERKRRPGEYKSGGLLLARRQRERQAGSAV